MKNIFIVSGPSGSGEDSIIEGLQKILPIERVITTTTRSMRKGESDGHPYHFISSEDFQEGIAKDEFIEYAREYNDQYYGVTKSELERVSKSGKIGIWKIEYQGTIAAKKIFPEIAAVFINAPLEVLADRIRRRDNADEAFVEERMNYTKEWLKHIAVYDYIIENQEGALEEAIKKTASVIQNHLEKK